MVTGKESVSMLNSQKGIRESRGDRCFTVFDVILMLFILCITIYPIYYVILASVSDPAAVNSGRFMLIPVNFTLKAYNNVFHESKVFSGYGNTILYTVTGTLLGLTVSMFAGYSLAQKTLPMRKLIMGIFVFTMYFSGGIIPLYIVVKDLSLVNTRWIIVILGSTSVYNIILIRTFIQSTIPMELYDAAHIDGCGNGRFFFVMVVPLSKAIIAVIALYLAVGYWNSYYNAMMFLSDMRKWPLQMVLREILSSANSAQFQDSGNSAAVAAQMAQVIKYGIIVVSAAPLIIVYPFLQRYFIQGVMIGSLKG